MSGQRIAKVRHSPTHIRRRRTEILAAAGPQRARAERASSSCMAAEWRLVLARPGYIGGPGQGGGVRTLVTVIIRWGTLKTVHPLAVLIHCFQYLNLPTFSQFLVIFSPPLPVSPPEFEYFLNLANSQSWPCQDLPWNRSASDCIQHNICFADSEPSPSQPSTRRTNCADCANGEGMATSNIAKLKRL